MRRLGHRRAGEAEEGNALPEVAVPPPGVPSDPPAVSIVIDSALGATGGVDYDAATGTYSKVVNATLPAGYDQLTQEEKDRVPTQYVVVLSAPETWTPFASPMLAPASTDTAATSTVITYPKRCQTTNATITARNNIWPWLYKMTASVDHCYNGAKVLSYTPLRGSAQVAYWPSVAGWTFNQWVNNSNWQPGGTTWYVRNYLQGQFTYCPIRIGACFQTDYPYIYLDVNGKGQYKVSSGGWQ